MKHCLLCLIYLREDELFESIQYFCCIVESWFLRPLREIKMQEFEKSRGEKPRGGGGVNAEYITGGSNVFLGLKIYTLCIFWVKRSGLKGCLIE